MNDNHDFRTVILYAGGKKKEKKTSNQNKGQRAEVSEFYNAILGRKGILIPFDDIFTILLATFKVIESILSGKSLKILHEIHQD